jgi:hypothetical protein
MAANFITLQCDILPIPVFKINCLPWNDTAKVSGIILNIKYLHKKIEKFTIFL